ncbi:MAG: nickel-dependent lactate racemase [Lentisphaerae bacterium]|nr:nickel-dependent lactate racemase [Lentisphaerota bacterium]
MQVDLKYDRETIPVRVPDAALEAVLLPRERPGLPDLEGAVRDALRHPVGAPLLSELVAPGKTVAILVDDTTRPVPTARLLSVLLPELEAAGAQLERTTVICATGVHRVLSDAEFAALLGPYAGRVRAISHEAENEATLTELGTSSWGNPIKINRVFFEADVKCVVCDTEFHQFCGYGGGAKSVLPGIADRASVERCHARMDEPGAEPGRIRGNPVREEIEEAGRMAGVDFILNVVLNRDREVTAVFAGDLVEAFLAGARVYDGMYKVAVPRTVDTVIVSAGGAPRDINLYQAQKAIETGKKVVRQGGTIIALAACPEGHGSDRFHRWMCEEQDLNAIIRKTQERFILGAHKAYQIAREVLWADVHLYSMLPEAWVRAYRMHPLKDTAAIEALADRAQRVVVIPEATLTLPVLEESLETKA